MQLSKNAASRVDRSPWLSKCLSTYFAPGQFVFDRSHLVAVKWRSDEGYAVMLFQVGEDFYIADVAEASYRGDEFVVCNDAGDCKSEAMWKGVKVDPWCDGYTFAEER